MFRASNWLRKLKIQINQPWWNRLDRLRQSRSIPRGQRGDTFVEVMISIVILALVLTTAYALSTHSLSNSVDAQKRSKALAIAQSQVAQMINAQNALSDGLQKYALSQDFCINNDGSANTETQAGDNGVGVCAADKDGYATGVNYNNSTGVFTVTTQWPRNGTQNANQVQLYYKSPTTYVAQNDTCPNIDGNQAEVPDGYTKDTNGNCVVVAQPPAGGGGGGGAGDQAQNEPQSFFPPSCNAYKFDSGNNYGNSFGDCPNTQDGGKFYVVNGCGFLAGNNSEGIAYQVDDSNSACKNITLNDITNALAGNSGNLLSYCKEGEFNGATDPGKTGADCITIDPNDPNQHLVCASGWEGAPQPPDWDPKGPGCTVRQAGEDPASSSSRGSGTGTSGTDIFPTTPSGTSYGTTGSVSGCGFTPNKTPFASMLKPYFGRWIIDDVCGNGHEVSDPPPPQPEPAPYIPIPCVDFWDWFCGWNFW